MSYENLSGKTALITGGAKRIGAALALALSRQGAGVILHYNSAEAEAQKLAREIKDAGGNAAILQGNLAQEAVAFSIVDNALRHADRIDILINNASIFDEIGFEDITGDAINKNMNINAVAPLMLSRRFAEQKIPGVIINMVDTMVMDYDKKHVPYHLSKRALHALTKMMAVEFAPDIRVNAVAPGLILPPPGKDEAYLERLIHSNPLNRHGGPEDIVRAVLYLIDAEFVTGQTLYVDGGRHLRGSMYE